MWIELHDTLPDNKKVVNLAAELHIDIDMAVGKLVRLWLWALTNRRDGDFSQNDEPTIAEKMRWTKSASLLVNAMVRHGLLDKTEGGYHIHDWEEYAISLMARDEERKKKTRERVAKYRKDKQVTYTATLCDGDGDVLKETTQHIEAPDCNAEKPVITYNKNAPVTEPYVLRNAHGTGTVRLCNAPTIPYHIELHTCNQSVSPLQGRDLPLTDRLTDAQERLCRYMYEHQDDSRSSCMLGLIDTVESVYTAGETCEYSINGAAISGRHVMAMYDRLSPDHLEYVLERLDDQAPDIANARAYTIACLYNAPQELAIGERVADQNIRQFRAALDQSRKGLP